MAVPGSGELSLLKIAREKVHDNYNSTSAVTGSISLKDVTQGGNGGGSGTSFDVTNGFSPSHPDNDVGFGMQEFYSYDHDYVVAACNITYREGNNGTFTFPIDLGSGTGIVRIEYQAYSVPDKFVFTWNGNTYTSGSTSGNYDGYVGAQSAGGNNYVTLLRNATGDSNLEITTYTTSDYNPSGSNNSQDGGRYFIEFNKNAATGSMVATVTAPLSGTAWWFSISCPGQQVIWASNGVAPSVQTNAETNVTSSGFTMNGQTTSKGKTSNYSTTGTISARGFVYKTGSTSTPFIAGDSGTSTQQVDTSNTIGSFSRVLTSLSSGTTYSYRVYASNAAGTTYGSIESVTTSSNNITMTLYMDNYLSTSDTPNYLQVYVDGTLYQVTNGTQTSYSISVPPSTSVAFSAFSEYVTSQSSHTLEMYDESNLYETDSGTTPSLSFNYTTPASNFNMYASAY